ncbi:hypothetical protein [Microbispora rosea]|uniref:hypothetical protein n=1 Tax=Microbispora rosea TaxID=58117 RepID=UPI0037B07B0B
MTTTTDRLVATKKAASEPGNCWVLTDSFGVDLDYGDGIFHFDTKTKAEERAEHEDLEHRPRRLDKPCVLVACSCCDYVFDEDEWTNHFESLDEARKVLPDFGWVPGENGTWRCEGCAKGTCDCEADRA